LILIKAASAQTAEDALRLKIAGVHYTPLARMARIQGDVHVVIRAGSGTV
jgi:hypothetical protein